MGINVKDLDDISSVAAGDKILTIDVDDTSDSADGTLKLSTVSQVGAGGAGDMQASTYDPTSVEADAFDVDNHVSGTTNKVFTATEQSKLSGIETGADVTDTTNVTAAGALMDSEVDADIKTLSLPANTTISTFGASLVDDASASTALSTLGAAASTHTHTESDITDLGSYLTDISGEALTDLSNVVVTSVADNEVLAYDSGGNWINQTATEAGLAEASHTHVEADITDLGTYLTDITGENLDDLADVVITTPANNEVLAYDTGGNFINQTASEAGLSEVGHTHTESDITDLDHTDAAAIHDDVSGEIAALTDKASPHNNDMIIIEDSEATNAKKRVSIGNLPTGSGMTSLTLSGDSGSDQTLSDGDTLEIAGGTGIDTVAGATDTVTVSVDSTVQIKPTEGGFVDGDKTKLDGIETAADVTDTDNVTAAGALMDSEVDADIKTLSLPASTTISAFGATLVDDANAATARTTLDVDQAGTDNSTDVTLAGTPDYITITGQEITRNQIDLTTDVTGVLPEANLPNASTSAEGVVELATSAETTTGTDTGRVITPDGLAGSTVFGQKVLQATVVDYTTDTATGDGKFYYVIPQAMNGMNLIRVHARVITAGTTGTTDIQIHNVTDSQDMLSTKLTIDSGETGSDTAATAAVINTTYDDVATNDLLRVDIDAVSTTAAKGLILTMEFRLP